jgi:epoxyqueuosine reductase QueG
MEHPIIARIQRETFTALGWFEPRKEDALPTAARFVILIGNVGPAMFGRFMREKRNAPIELDTWTKSVVDSLASDLDATAMYPFEKPPLPFLTWARRAGAGHVSPLGLNIHSTFGLWHAYRAALVFPVVFDLPAVSIGSSPCESCADKPCLSACPVSAFDGKNYDVQSCATHIATQSGQTCMTGGCKARLACPVGKRFEYAPLQKQFHMQAFLQARQQEEPLRK